MGTETKNKPKPLRYMLFQLLRKLINDHSASERHAILLKADFTLEELVAIQKTINGMVYHKARRDAKLDATSERIENEQL